MKAQFIVQFYYWSHICKIIWLAKLHLIGALCLWFLFEEVLIFALFFWSILRQFIVSKNFTLILEWMANYFLKWLNWRVQNYVNNLNSQIAIFSNIHNYSWDLSTCIQLLPLFYCYSIICTVKQQAMNNLNAIKLSEVENKIKKGWKL